MNETNGELEVTNNTRIVRPHSESEAARKAVNRHGLPIHNLNAEDDPNMFKKQQFFQRHTPISFSVFSNIPGYVEKPFTVVEPDVSRLIQQFVDHLEELAKVRRSHLRSMYSNTLTALESLVQKAKDVYEDKKTRKEYIDMACLHMRKVTTVLRRFETWLDQCPVIGFNSGRYDLPLIKEYLFPLLVKNARELEDKDIVYDFDRRVARHLRIPMYPKQAEERVDIIDKEMAHSSTKVVFKKSNFLLSKVGEVEYSSNDEDMEEDETEDMEDDETEDMEDDENEYMEDDETEDLEDDENDDDYEEFELEDVQKERKSAINIPENPKVKIKGLPSITKRGTSILCIRTDSLVFLDMSLYLAAGTSLNKFQSAWQAADKARMVSGKGPDQFGSIELSKLPFPYDFLDSVVKLEFKGVPPRSAFFSHLRGKNITDEEYETMKTTYNLYELEKFVDYLRLYNETDVRPFLQACEKQHMQYYEECSVDMFKSCISLPGITLKYLSSKTDNYQFALWTSKDEELQREMRSDMTGGLSIVQHRLAVAGETLIRSNEICKGQRPEKDFHLVKSIQGYDANALYLWAVGQDMPCGFHTLWKNSTNEAYMTKERCSKPDAAVWLQYCALKSGYEIINKWTHGFEQRLGPVQIPVDGYCASTKTVYEYLGCFWHCHGSPECRMDKVTDKNVKTRKDKNQCHKELEERKIYIESLGMKLEFIYECKWKQILQQPATRAILKSVERKFETSMKITTKRMMKAIRKNTVFGFAQVTMDTPEHLQQLHHFSDYPPIIKNTMVGREHLSAHMLDHCQRKNILQQPRRALVNGFKAEKQWLLTAMISYLMEKGLRVKKLHQVLQYDKAKPFQWFVDKVTNARAAADSDPSLEILGQGYKLLGNTAYGKTITDLSSHTDSYIVPYSMARELANDPFLLSLEPVANTDCYTVVMRKRRIRYSLPEQVGIAVYQWAKIRMLQFAYDFLGEFCDPYKYAWMQSDTDSCYIMMAAHEIENIVLPHKRVEFEREKYKWLVENPAQKRTPGLFKLEYSGVKMVCLNPKSYHVVNENGDSKSATKRANKACHFQFEQFVDVLKTECEASGYNVGFQLRKNNMYTYLCERTALTYFYGKRHVLSDGISTEPNGNF